MFIEEKRERKKDPFRTNKEWCHDEMKWIDPRDIFFQKKKSIRDRPCAFEV